MDTIVCEYWIYILLIVKDEQLIKACYIGQTKNIQRRLLEHHKNSRWGKGSYYLQELAEEKNAQTNVVILEKLNCIRRKADEREAIWISSALDGGFLIPGMSNWVRYNKFINAVSSKVDIPENKLLDICTPLSQVINSDVVLDSILL